MLDLDRILNQERLLRAMTGLNRQAFNELLSQFADTYERTVFNSLANRKRAPGGTQAHIENWRNYFIS
ncbi:hypothetical protein [Cylindrospermopsis raciborskii]|uniref:hypothetical protein n=1 Tax=Cylindrospermopsis raciborskii TaxID=77022 RepID=UPI0001C15C2E|nr:hypothetical protein [Cylindrospermopsis raciborskii]EFA68899.1 Transposase, IS5 family protein [Cylindrospermopsis raciborskii CS-505]